MRDSSSTHGSLLWAAGIGLVGAGTILVMLSAASWFLGPISASDLSEAYGARSQTEAAALATQRDASLVGVSIACLLMVVGGALAWRLRPVGVPGGRWVAVAAGVAVVVLAVVFPLLWVGTLGLIGIDVAVV